MPDTRQDAGQRGTATSAAVRVTGLVAVAALQAYWFLQPVPLALKTVAALFVIVALARPASGVLVFAGLAPLSTLIAGLCGAAAGMGAHLLEQMALGIGAGVLLRRPVGHTRIGRPALLLAVVGGNPAAAPIPAAAAPLARSVTEGSLLRDLLFWRTAQSSPVWGPMFAALTITECALLGWAVEHTIRREPRLAARLVLIALIGHAGSAALSVQAIVEAAMRTGDVLEALPPLLMSVRVSMQSDWNAAASALLLAGVAGIGLLKARGPQRAGIGLLLLLVAAGLWITGSRIAIVLAVLTTVARLGWLIVRPIRRRGLVAITMVLLTISVGAWLTARYPPGRNDTASATLQSRVILMKAGLRMFQEAPVFGIGIKGFYGASTRFTEPDPTDDARLPRENAHNNFVQVLAELGLTGFAALAWWLWVIGASGARAQIAQPDTVRGALLLAVLVCVGTWLTGHPLLVPEFAFVFWLYGSTLVALTPAPPPDRSAWLRGSLVAALVLSVPWRAVAVRNTADLEHQGLGVSMWEHDDIQRYRKAGAAFALFLPAAGRPVEVPIRRAPGAPDSLVVNIRIGDQLVNAVIIEGDVWRSVLITVPSGARRFERVDFLVDHEAPDGWPRLQPMPSVPDVLLRVGRASPR